MLFAGMYFFGYLYSASELLDPYNLSILAGAAAYVVFMSQFLLSSRLRFLEKRIPQDRLLALHGGAGMASAALVLIHGILKYILTVRHESLALQSSLGLAALTLSVLLTPLALLVLRGPRHGRRDKSRKSPRYEGNRIAHNLFALAGLAATVHVLLATSTWSVALRIFTLGWGLLTLGSYVNHKLLRPRRRRRLVLKDIVEEAPGVHRYVFDGDIPRQSGQFAYVKFTSDPPGREDHPFTISSPAGSAVELTVRGLGDFTGVMPGTPVGTEASFDGPYGHFHPGGLPEGRPLVFLAAGIGITPVLSLARDPGMRVRHPMTIIWSISGPADESVSRELADLQAAGELELRIVYTKKAPEGRVFGRLDSDALKPFTEDLVSAEWFICGPSGFSNAMRRHLLKLGVRRRHITEERFTW